MSNYFRFIFEERRTLSFGVAFTFFSSFGQTFLVSLFVPYFLEDFELSNASFGAIYSGATLISAALLPYMGQWIDRVSLRRYSFFVATGLLLGCIFIISSWHIALLFVGIVFIRLNGQGLSAHTAETAMARFYEGRRGKALSVASLGYPLGEALLPIAIATILTVMHWRMTWGLIAILISVVLYPLIYLLIGRNSAGRSNPSKSEKAPENARESYSIIFSDRRIWFLIPAVLMPPFWATGLFLYQISIADELGWTAALIASAFVAYAILRVVGAIFIGPLIDRFSAQVLFPFFLLPMILGILVPIFYSPNWVAFLYLGMIGVTMGAGGNIKSALWAELFGSSMIGTVRSLFTAIMATSTALSPFIIGWLLDQNVAFEYVLAAGVITSVISSILALRIHPRFQPKPS
jgi:predicted MFS family arabinose efflux permease